MRAASIRFRVARCVLLLAVVAPARVNGQVCQPRTDAPGKECFVSLSGDDANAGAVTRPFRTIARGLEAVQAGDMLTLRRGAYLEAVHIAGKHGTLAQPIVIRSYPGERVFIDGSLPQFRTLRNDDWERVQDDAHGGGTPHADEYVSRVKVTGFVRGAFIDRQPYTRLITYARLEDLRADNETFDRIDTDDPRPGPDTVLECESPSPCVPATYRYPWVYMGPGIWVDRSVSLANPQPLHIRLSHTHNDVPGLPDHRGATDPREIRIAIATESMQPLRVTNSSHVRLNGLVVRFGGDVSVYVGNSRAIVFDRVHVWASTYGVRTHATAGLTFEHCDFSGGKPSWYFRNDGKKQYWFLQDGAAVLNSLGQQTMRSLFVPSRLDVGTVVRNSEFHDGHDLYLGGSDVDFHHNWIRDLNDEGIVLDAYGKENVRVHHNVIVKTLSAISFASQAVGDAATVGGPFYIYRNLIDLREPTAGFRPRQTGDTAVWRYGSTFKSNGADGPYALFQNTLLVYGQDSQASYLHFRNLQGSHRRRSFNNIFVAVQPDTASDRPVTLVPSPVFPAETDGNLYQRIGHSLAPLFLNLPYQFGGALEPAATFACLAGCPTALIGSPLFERSRSQYAPGYESQSIAADPQFVRVRADGRAAQTDDLRLRPTSPAAAAGVELGDDLSFLDDPPNAGRPDIGAFPLASAPLRVGIDGRRAYPAS